MRIFRCSLHLNLVVALVAAVHVTTSHAQAPAADSVVAARYIKREILIAMRDGTKLFTAIYTPRDSARRYPILLMRTPYGVAPYGTSAYP